MENLMIFDGQEVKVKTDEGKILINLVHTAKCCGLTNVGNSGKPKVRWSNLKNKLISIYSGDTNLTPLYIDEINYLLDEIENSEDRNSIFMSNWMAKRLAMECNSEQAKKYKNFLADLDEKRENGLLNNSPQELMNVVQNTMMTIMPNMVTEIVKQFAPVIQESKKQVDESRELLHAQATIYQNEREELKQMMGLRSVNTMRLSKTIKEQLTDKLGYKVTAKDEKYKKVMNEVFKEFNTIKWEDISITKYNNVFAFLDTYINENF